MWKPPSSGALSGDGQKVRENLVSPRQTPYERSGFTFFSPSSFLFLFYSVKGDLGKKKQKRKICPGEGRVIKILQKTGLTVRDGGIINEA